MLQIFSLKLTNLPPASAAAGPVEIYGFIAVRDLLDPLRNYVFNHTRSHPFVMQDPMSDPFIYLSGPKRGVYLQSRALIEYDLRIKSPASGGEEADDDSPLIDGAATLSELTWTNAVLTNRIAGDLGAAAVDMRRALFRDAVEATVDVWITKLAAGDGGGGIDLSMTGCVSNLPEDEIKLFRGVVREPCALGRFVVAARLDSYLFLQFRVAEGVVSSDEFEWFAFRAPPASRPPPPYTSNSPSRDGDRRRRRRITAAQQEDKEDFLKKKKDKEEMETQQLRERNYSTEAEIDDEEEEGVFPAEVLEGMKHGDGSIYRPDAYQMHSLYRIADTTEGCLEPMRLTHPNPDCYPCAATCRQHGGCNMLQIYSLKLVGTPSATTGGGSIQLYGFMAIRDLLDPFRNYVFNRTRDDPFIIQLDDPHSDLSIYPSGPKRGVYFNCTVLIEYDMKIIKVDGEDAQQHDLQLIDGVVTCDELTWNRGPSTYRIEGECGGYAVDFSQALIRGAVEATVEVCITRVAENNANGDAVLDLSISGVLPPRTGEIKLFRGVIDKPRALNRFVVAVGLTSELFLLFKDAASGSTGKFAFRATAHGCVSEHRNFDFATIEVNVTWSNMI
ncbi:hypothetical protein HU200_061101 [Digitaria exilis]|uniref:DUF6598 domain-containing protein n=1 Tax=Digitaria exilis TaxID=1010633 RepID=A0A835DWX1_9POAL|nr:hypothetical protein HU200_061101 [Digitaria exilis]